MHAERRNHSIRLLCRVLEIHRSSFNAWLKRHSSGASSRRTRSDTSLQRLIRVGFAAHHGRYGAPRLRAWLAQQGIATSTKRVARLLREAGLCSRRKRAWRSSSSTPRPGVARNTLSRDFAPSGLNQRWCMDITCLGTSNGKAWLAVVMDLGSRRVIGWELSSRQDQGLALRALRQALQLRGVTAQPLRIVHESQPEEVFEGEGARAERPDDASSLLVHSDRGVQFTSSAFQALLERYGLRQSLSRIGNCWDNAVMESFFSTLKRECGGMLKGRSLRATREAVRDYIEGWYNPTRLHSTLGYRSPLAYEIELRRSALADEKTFTPVH